MSDDKAERRKYRFRAWDQQNGKIYPVTMVGRGMVMLQDQLSERTSPLANVRLMQYSGVADAKGQEIYEADILELDHDGQLIRKQVIIQNGAFRLVGLKQDKQGPKLLTSEMVVRSKARVVGNLYQQS